MPASKQHQEHAVDRAARLYTVLKQCADSNVAAPDLKTLSQRFSVGPRVIANALNFLVGSGMIEIHGKGDQRTVSICATGKMTVPAAPVGRNRSKPKLKRKAR